MNEAILEFCKAREALRMADRETRSDRAEQNDAERTIGGLLCESMMRHDVSYLTVPSTAHAPERYARVRQPPRRACRIKTVEDAVSLVTDVARHVSDIPAEDLPNAVSKLVQERARDRGPPPGPPRVTIVTRPPAKKRPKSDAEDVRTPYTGTAETQRLFQQYVGAHQERQETRGRMRILREDVKAAETRLLPTLSNPVTVQMSKPNGKGNVLMRLERALPPTPRPPPSTAGSTIPEGGTASRAGSKIPEGGTKIPETPFTGVGIRSFLNMVRESTEESIQLPRENLDAALQTCLRRKLEGATTSTQGSKGSPPARLRLVRQL